MIGDLISIEQELCRLSSALDQLTDEFQSLCRIAADARTDYDLAWAKELLRVNDTEDGATQKVKEAMTTRVCASQMREARVSEATRDAAKERIRAIESLLTVHQSRLKWMDEGRRF